MHQQSACRSLTRLLLHGRRTVSPVIVGACAAALLVLACATDPAPEAEGVRAFVGARIIDGTGIDPIENGVLVVREGRIEAVGAAGDVDVPAGAERIDLSGATIIPGLINAHGHVGGTRGLASGPQQYTRENLLDQLSLYARYGVTTVVSLGDDREEGIRLRDEQDRPDLDRARLYVAGPVLSPNSPEEAVRMVAEVHEMGVDWVKIRVDDGLGQGEAMSPEIYEPLIEEAQRRGIPFAAHIVNLEHARSLVHAGVDLIAHSVRDAPVDETFIALMRNRDVCYCPTFTREVSTFVYGSRPSFFDDPFFLREADPEVLAQLENPDRQRGVQESASAQFFERAIPLAQANVKALSDGGVRIAFGTDSGPPGRFQGFFEHMEMELMAEAGMTPMQILVSATGDAARCMRLHSDLGTLEAGKHADFVVLDADPLVDVRNARAIRSVWIAGNRVPGT